MSERERCFSLLLCVLHTLPNALLTTLRVQYPYTLENHSTTITCTSLSTSRVIATVISNLELIPGFLGPLSTSSMRIHEGLKIYTGKRHEDMGKHLKVFPYFCKRSKILVTFAHVRNHIQKVVDNGFENPSRACTHTLYLHPQLAIDVLTYEHAQAFSLVRCG